MKKIRVAIHGAAGRMGRRLVALGSADPALAIAAAIESAGHPDLGRDAGELAGVAPLNVPLASDFAAGVDALIDFSVPEGAEAATAACRDRGVPLVLATTGLSPQQQQQVREAAEKIPIVWAPNMSLAVNLALKLAAIAAEALKCAGGADVEIVERHHRFKEDAPSGTALLFGETIARVMGQNRHAHGRQGRTGKRGEREIGYHALRAGDHPGEHTIVFGLMGESLELSVRATGRDSYALGALEAAKFVARQKPGLYSMADVLGL
jgi:4-hydroxy-tetrahydrodipicolinate reductase